MKHNYVGDILLLLSVILIWHSIWFKVSRTIFTTSIVFRLELVKLDLIGQGFSNRDLTTSELLSFGESKACPNM
jgi:hypothetical protein